MSKAPLKVNCEAPLVVYSSMNNELPVSQGSSTSDDKIKNGSPISKIGVNYRGSSVEKNL